MTVEISWARRSPARSGETASAGMARRQTSENLTRGMRGACCFMMLVWWCRGSPQGVPVHDILPAFNCDPGKRRKTMRIWDSAARAIWLLATFAVAAPALLGGRLRAETLDARIRPLIEAHQGQVAGAVRHLENGDGFSHRADEPMPTASLI